MSQLVLWLKMLTLYPGGVKVCCPSEANKTVHVINPRDIKTLLCGITQNLLTTYPGNGYTLRKKELNTLKFLSKIQQEKSKHFSNVLSSVLYSLNKTDMIKLEKVDLFVI